MALVLATVGNSASISGGTPDTSLSTGNFSVATTIGDTIVVISSGVGGTTASTGTTTAVTDTLGNTYTEIDAAVNTTGNRRVSMWRTVSAFAGTNAVTATYTQNSNEAYNQAIRAYLLDGTILLGVYNQDNLTSTGTLSGTGTVSYGDTAPPADSLHITGISSATSGLTVGTGYTSGGLSGQLNAEHKQAATAATFTWSGGSASAQYAAVGASFCLSVTALAVTSVTASSGSIAGGTSVTVAGAGFASGATVKFDTSAATSVVVVNQGSITCTTPAHAYGAVDVSVTSGSSTVTGTALYTYTSPGWARTDDDFATAADVVIPTDTLKYPRNFTEVATFAASGANYLGGSPGAACVFNNRLYYPFGGYTVNTTAPTVRVFDGDFDREMAAIPATASGGVSQAVLSMLSANNTIYFSTFDSGTSSTTWAGRVFTMNPYTGVLTNLGDAVFASGHMPYALAWYQDKLWVGTNRGDTGAAVGRVYWIRPGIDTAWTLDHTTTGSQGSVTSMLGFQDDLYVGLMSASTVASLLRKRSGVNGTYSTSDTMPSASFADNNGFISLVSFGNALYNSAWNSGNNTYVRKLSGGSWTTKSTVAGASALPYIGLFVENSRLYVIGSKASSIPILLRTSDGDTYTNITTFLPSAIEPIGPAWGAISVLE